MEQPGGQTWNGGEQISNGGRAPLPPADDGPDATDHFWWWMKFEHGSFRIPDPRSFQPLHSNNMMAALDNSSLFFLQPL